MNILDFFKPRTLEVSKSKYSGDLRVVSGFGYRYITTGPLTQTGGIVKDVWQPVLDKYGKSGKTWLVLGLAGGTIAKHVSDTKSPRQITGVEIDPEMVRLGKKYLDLDKIPTLEIFTEDAVRYVSRTKAKYDYVLVDMYLGDKLPTFVYDQKFLKKLSTIGSTVIFNHLFYDAQKKLLAEKLITDLQKIFFSVELSRQLTNLLVICSQRNS